MSNRVEEIVKEIDVRNFQRFRALCKFRTTKFAWFIISIQFLDHFALILSIWQFELDSIICLTFNVDMIIIYTKCMRCRMEMDFVTQNELY